MSKRKAEVQYALEAMEVRPLGGGNEVGRSCILLKYKGKTILVQPCMHIQLSANHKHSWIVAFCHRNEGSKAFRFWTIWMHRQLILSSLGLSSCC